MSRPRTPKAAQNALNYAVSLIGSQSEVARQLNIRVSAVNKWVLTGKVSPERAIDLERLTNGKVSRADLRPDLFGKQP